MHCMQEAAPWSKFKTDPEAAAADIRLALNLIAFYAVISAPFIPDAADQLLSAMQTETTAWPSDIAKVLARLEPGHGFTVPDSLFAKITDEQREDWATRFAGIRN